MKTLVALKDDKAVPPCLPMVTSIPAEQDADAESENSLSVQTPFTHAALAASVTRRRGRAMAAVTVMVAVTANRDGVPKAWMAGVWRRSFDGAQIT